MDELPTPESTPEFWRDIQSDHVKNNINFQILNEIRKYEPELLSEAACRVQLAKLKAMIEMLDLPKSLLSHKNETQMQMNDLLFD